MIPGTVKETAALLERIGDLEASNEVLWKRLKRLVKRITDLEETLAKGGETVRP